MAYTWPDLSKGRKRVRMSASNITHAVECLSRRSEDEWVRYCNSYKAIKLNYGPRALHSRNGTDRHIQS